MQTPDAAPEFDSVTEDAINSRAPIPPMELPQDQRRAFLGGVYSYRKRHTICPYTNEGCRKAWQAGYERARKERNNA